MHEESTVTDGVTLSWPDGEPGRARCCAGAAEVGELRLMPAGHGPLVREYGDVDPEMVQVELVVHLPGEVTGGEERGFGNGTRVPVAEFLGMCRPGQPTTYEGPLRLLVDELLADLSATLPVTAAADGDHARAAEGSAGLRLAVSDAALKATSMLVGEPPAAWTGGVELLSLSGHRVGWLTSALLAGMRAMGRQPEVLLWGLRCFRLDRDADAVGRVYREALPYVVHPEADEVVLG